MAAELKIGIGADNSGLSKGLRDAEAQITAFVSKIEKIGQIGEQLSSIGQKMSVGLTLPILALGGSAVKTYGDLQSLKMGLEAVMGSANAANSEFEKLREVAKLPGLGLKEAAKGSVALQSAGFSADEARRSLMAFGNALATVGKGANELGLVNLALTQIQNKTGGFGQDLRQLTEQLPQLRGAMQAAFGTVDSEQVQKLGLTGRQVVSMLTAEFEKLPKVTGGIKNAFENLSDNLFINMSRIGKIIDDTFDISGIIDKLTSYMDKAVSVFENFSPAVQKTILVVTGLVAAAGPLLVVVGGLMAALPGITMALGGLKVAFLALTGPVGLAVTLLGALAAGFLVFSDYSRTAADRSAQWKDSLANANAEAATQVAKLRDLYNATQDSTKSVKEKTDAVEELQRTYPVEFGNLSKQMILNGQAEGTYRALAASIYDVARAKAAQKQIDKITEDSFNKEIELRKALNKEIENYKNPKAFNYTSGTAGSGIREATISAEEMQRRAAENIFKYVKALKAHGKATEAELKIYSDYVKKGFKEVETATVAGVDAAAAAIEKKPKKKGKEEPIFISGSEGWYRQQIDNLEKLKENAVIGSDLWNSLRDQIETFNNVINPPDFSPIVQNYRGFVNQLGEEFNTLAALETRQKEINQRIADNTRSIPEVISESSARLAETTKSFNEALTGLINQSLTNTISDSFASLGQAIASGENGFAAAGKSLLGSFGGFMQDLGKMAIAYGIEALALKMALKSFNPYIAIAAGAALVAIGSVFSSKMSSMGSNYAGGGSGGGISTSGGGGSNFTSSSFTSGGNVGGEVVFRIAGTDLLGVLKRADADFQRLN